MQHCGLQDLDSVKMRDPRVKFSSRFEDFISVFVVVGSSFWAGH